MALNSVQQYLSVCVFCSKTSAFPHLSLLFFSFASFFSKNKQKQQQQCSLTKKLALLSNAKKRSKICHKTVMLLALQYYYGCSEIFLLHSFYVHVLFPFFCSPINQIQGMEKSHNLVKPPHPRARALQANLRHKIA